MVVIQALLVAGVVLLPLPALILGWRGVVGSPGYRHAEPGDRASLVVLMVLRGLALLLVFALSAITLVSCIGAMIKGVQLHGLVYVFFGLDLLFALMVLFTFGRRARRPVRRRVTPAAR
ncbi:MAG TPA: hypothetical protein VIH08_05000 [Blastococcus sp.]